LADAAGKVGSFSARGAFVGMIARWICSSRKRQSLSGTREAFSKSGRRVELSLTRSPYLGVTPDRVFRLSYCDRLQKRWQATAS
jgi:hypothetical protein